jgi:hypothetical protein
LFNHLYSAILRPKNEGKMAELHTPGTLVNMYQMEELSMQPNTGNEMNNEDFITHSGLPRLISYFLPNRRKIFDLEEKDNAY